MTNPTRPYTLIVFYDSRDGRRTIGLAREFDTYEQARAAGRKSRRRYSIEENEAPVE